MNNIIRYILSPFLFIFLSCFSEHASYEAKKSQQDRIVVNVSTEKCYSVRIYLSDIYMPRSYQDVGAFKKRFGEKLIGSKFEIERGGDRRAVIFSEENVLDFVYNYTGPAYVIIANRLCDSSELIQISYSLSETASNEGTLELKVEEEM